MILAHIVDSEKSYLRIEADCTNHHADGFDYTIKEIIAVSKITSYVVDLTELLQGNDELIESIDWREKYYEEHLNSKYHAH